MSNKLKEICRYPWAMVGLVLIVLFVGFCVYTMITIPPGEAIRQRRPGPDVRVEYPRNAAPVWQDWFTRDKLPRTIKVSLEDRGEKTIEPVGDGMNRVEIVLPFDYHYDGFPSELSLFLEADFEASQENISVFMRKPNEKTVTLNEDLTIRESHIYRISQDTNLHSKLGDTAPHVGLFVKVPVYDNNEPLQGSYELVVQTEWLEGNEFLEARLVVYGQVCGLAGTDEMRRDTFTLALPLGARIGFIVGVFAAGLLILSVIRKSRNE